MRSRSALLLRLAHDWEERGAYAEAIKCLSPVCDDAGELPTVTAAARLQLARLLLAHFDNVAQAKSVLLSTVGGGRREGGGPREGWAHCRPCATSRRPREPASLHPLPATPTPPPCSNLQEQDLRQTQGNHLLKCEVCDALALANQRLGAVQAEADALTVGLKACRAGATSKDK